MIEAEMRALGFTDHREGFWYWYTNVDDQTTLNVTINKVTRLSEVVVMNEFFMQPEFYGDMKPEWRDRIIARIDAELARLNVLGLNVSIDHHEYAAKGKN